jgi:ADP-ribose pyrophosphatase YjhB (NUDIX family)
MMRLLAKVWKALHLPKGIQLNVMRVLQDQFLVGVTGIIFNDKNQILLLKHSYREVSWGLPGGYVKAREHPKEGLEREVKEETGLVVSADTRYKIRTDRETARLDIVYIGTFIGGEFTPSAEVTEAKFYSFEDFPLIRRKDLALVERIISARTQMAMQSSIH